jgi:predicted DNA-binding transcriptional regulator AlpA
VNLHELQDALKAGRATVTIDDVLDTLPVSRATFYRAVANGEVPGVLKLGRRRLLSLPAYLIWLMGESPHARPSSDSAES